jgi:hypothetical protein
MSDVADKSKEQGAEKPADVAEPEGASEHEDHDRHDHDHDHEQKQAGPEGQDLGPALLAAGSGLRSDVQSLVTALSAAHVYIPLSEDLPDAPEGQQIELDGDLTFRPHMILGEDEAIFAVAYSDPEYVEPMQASLGWTTSEGELKFICVPADVALDLAQVTIDGEPVSGLVFNPGTDQELVLQRDEVASLAQGVAIPLVGYVAEPAPGEENSAQVVEGAEPPPAELIAALSRVQAEIRDLVGFSLQTTFDPERDREPHLSITLTVIGRHDLNRPALADAVMDEAAAHLPAPGYADILFRDAPN